MTITFEVRRLLDEMDRGDSVEGVRVFPMSRGGVGGEIALYIIASLMALLVGTFIYKYVMIGGFWFLIGAGLSLAAAVSLVIWGMTRYSHRTMLRQVPSRYGLVLTAYGMIYRKGPKEHYMPWSHIQALGLHDGKWVVITDSEDDGPELFALHRILGPKPEGLGAAIVDAARSHGWADIPLRDNDSTQETVASDEPR